MEKDIAIKVSGVSKTFRIPHEKVSSVRGAVVNAFKKSSFEEFKALDDVSFEVKKGEFFGIIGRNGSGKSTLLKILAGIYQADKGKIQINGLISPFLELGIGFNPELSGRDNVYLNATVLGMTKKEIDKKFDDIVKFSELERFIDQKLKNYSSGMQVRLAFSVSIHANREILLMDEVLAVGDSNFQSKCLEEFNKYREMGKTVILVTHDISIVQRYCDRAMLLRDGKIVKVGKAEGIVSEYIYSNIAEEESRMQEDEKAIKSKMSSVVDNDDVNVEKNAKITSVEFLDEKRSSRNVFKSGVDMTIKINFKLKKGIGIVNFGVAIFNQAGVYIFGVNTLTEKFNGNRYVDREYFEVNFNNIPMRTDTYYIKAGIWGGTVASRFDFLDKSSSFKIISEDQNQGICNIPYNWS